MKASELGIRYATNEEIDDEITPLVMLLNRLPFFDTIGSCGGHGSDKPLITGVSKNNRKMLDFIEVVESSYKQNNGIYIWFKKVYQRWDGIFGEIPKIGNRKLNQFWDISISEIDKELPKVVEFLKPIVEKFSKEEK